ncbi:MFS transporter [Longispora albida]|uniref:MFS transporter n=1 Tax=Longispora albida TaxID=203523 RepID=UPI00036D6929|nr:MFS transporter [Longispora albida]
MPGTVIGLGMVSFFTDASSELVAAFLPVYLLYGLGVSYVQFGLLDGLYTGATAVLRLAGGHLADRLARPKAIALAGYGLSAFTKLGFPLAGASVAGIGGLLALDRAGKGIRTAPRDAMITAASDRGSLGRSFGAHRALDTAGALAGPLIAFALLAWVGNAYDAVFGASFCLGLVGVLILVFFVRDAPAPVVRPKVRIRESVKLLSTPALRRITLCVVVLGLATAGDAFLFVALAKQGGVPGNGLSLLPLGTAVIFLLCAVPAGRLADRLGRWRVFVAGQLLLVTAYGCVWLLTGWALVPVVLALHGLYYAATDGVLMAHVGGLLPEHLRSSGMAVVQAGQALARMAAAITFGALAQGWALGPAFGVFAAALLAATLFSTRASRSVTP